MWNFRQHERKKKSNLEKDENQFTWRNSPRMLVPALASYCKLGSERKNGTVRQEKSKKKRGSDQLIKPGKGTHLSAKWERERDGREMGERHGRKVGDESGGEEGVIVIC